jgi:hypothetical protein
MIWVLFLCTIATGKCEAVAAAPSMGQCYDAGREAKRPGKSFHCVKMREDTR